MCPLFRCDSYDAYSEVMTHLIIDHVIYMIAEFHVHVQQLLPMLQEYIVLAWQDLGEKHRDGTKRMWRLEEGKMLEELEANHKERVSLAVLVL